ncbi:hypothetical protein AB1L30_22550 [Bremerella sp. JC817]|uniref:WD40 repeat domain-containing protein n=1 Tax=Bremerella sp. JC817 TaxID=3231756 RepID=UPI003457EB2E
MPFSVRISLIACLATLLLPAMSLPSTQCFAQLEKSPWIEAADIRIPADKKAQITTGPPGCPVVIVNNDVWHVKSKRVVQTLPESPEIGDFRCLSANGMYFAAYGGSNFDKGRSVNVWNLVSGELVATVPGQSRYSYPVMKIMYNRYLLVAPDGGETLVIWDLQENRRTRDIKVRTTRIEEGQLTVSPDGKYLALVEGDRVSVLTLADGRYAGNLAAPIKDPTARFQSTLGANSIEDLEFSPDGQEMAAIYSSFDVQRLIVWDGSGQIKHDIPVNIPYGRFNEHSLTWLPDNKGWIVDGNVIHRESRKITAQIKRPQRESDQIAVLDPYFVLGRFGEDAEVITMIAIPWEEVERSLEAMKTPENCIVGPGVKASLLVYMRGESGESIEKARTQIGDAIVQQLRQYGMSYAADQDITFRFNVEPASLEHRLGQAKLALLRGGNPDPIWEHTFSLSSSNGFLDGLNKKQLNDAEIRSLAREISQLQIPYFIPRAPQYLPLPLVVE